MKIDLAGLLADNEELVRALAHHLADPAFASLRRDFLGGVKTAIDVKDLPGDINGVGEHVTVCADRGYVDDG